MWTAVVLSTLLMLGGIGRTAASDLQIYGKSLYSGHIEGRSRDGRQSRQPHQQVRSVMKNTLHRSLDLESFNMHVSPTTSKVNLPTIIRLYPPTAKPRHLHANMPLRFGRDNSPHNRNHPSNPNMPLRFGRDSDFPHDHSSSNNRNMPQRFGRSWKVVRLCRQCTARGKTSRTEQIQTKTDGVYWSLLQTLQSY